MPAPGELLDALEREAARSLSLWRRLTGPQLLVGSFLVLVALGTLALLTLPGLYTGERLSFIDALFTATSAVCVTGLIVVDTATYFTTFGQAVVLGMIQLGGLGILTFTTVVILLLGGRITLRSQAVVGAGGEILPQIDARRLVWAILRYTLVIEASGAFVLWLAWGRDLGTLGAIWPAVFHAISAFCNAGFSIFSDNLVGLAGRPLTLTVIMALIVIGGIGFLVLEELVLWRRGRARHRLSLHSRLALLTTGILIVVGAALFVAFEWTNALAPFPWYVKPFEALMLSVTPRTAGYNTVDYAELTSASLVLTMLLMLVGGSPGSTAGGLKTTTVAALAVLALARIRGRTTAAAFGRTIPDTTIQRAIGLVVFVVALLASVLLVLQVTELGGIPFPLAEGQFLQLAFEVVSAFDTVGLSMGITPDLSPAGKLLIAFLMFIGRVGPLTLAASMTVAAERARVQYRYASEDVIIG
ncbi:MAG TPA: TrkH family potassium uptake protein [Longimicrobiales bacterium]